MIPLLALGFFLTLEKLSSWYFDTYIMAEFEHSETGEQTRIFTDDDFEREVLQADRPVLVDFWAAWCGACKALAPTIDQLAAEYEGKIKVGKLDADANMDVARQYNIRAIPTVILFKDGEIKERFVGLRGKRDYQAVLDKCAGTVTSQRSLINQPTQAAAQQGGGTSRTRRRCFI